MDDSPDPVTAYAEAVLDGSILAGRLVKLACQRHLDDLSQGEVRGLRFDRTRASRALDFFSLLYLNPDLPFKLYPFGKFIVGSLFGWMGTDDLRRFRTAYVEMGKGNIKTPLAAGIGLYGLVADGEDAAEIFAAATKRDQAMILFRDAVRIVNSTPALKRKLKTSGSFPNTWNMAYEAKASFFRPIASEDGQSGPRPHFGLIDELHEHRTSLVVDMMRAGTKSRKQALIFEITNSGTDRTTICWQHHDYSARVLQGIVENDTWFAYVCQLDPCEKCREEGKDQPTEGCPNCDDWHEEKVWEKANPAIDVILPRKYLREQVAEARGMPAKEGIVRRLNFCAWTEVATRCIPIDRWDACGAEPVDLKSLEGRECYAGLDIGATSDFTALILLFPHDDAEEVQIKVDTTALPALVDGVALEPGTRTILRRSYTLVPIFWLPSHPVRRDEKTSATIDMWRRAKRIRTTEGDVVDYDLVLEDIVALAEKYDLRKIAFDRGFQGAQMGTNLMKHFGEDVVVSFAQGILSMAAPFREFMELIILGRLHHDNNPVMRWMVGNTAAETRGGLIKPSKEKSAEKIDGVAAACMATGVAMTAPPIEKISVEIWG